MAFTEQWTFQIFLDVHKLLKGLTCAIIGKTGTIRNKM